MTDTELHHCSATLCKYYDMGDCAFKRIEIDETGRCKFYREFYQDEAE